LKQKIKKNFFNKNKTLMSSSTFVNFSLFHNNIFFASVSPCFTFYTQHFILAFFIYRLCPKQQQKREGEAAFWAAKKRFFNIIFVVVSSDKDNKRKD
jgi:hypothetical protein